MQYRPFGKLKWQVSALGFGCMRLPVLEGNPEKIDEPQAIEMIRYGIDMGVNYIDTAYPYHEGSSELLVGKALLNGYRQKVKLATKLPVWLVQKKSDFDKYLNEQLNKLQTDSIDFYLLHALNKTRWSTLKSLQVQEWIEEAISDGRIKHIGFSFHDEFPVFETILNEYDGWTFCQIQYNYLDIDEQAGIKGLELAAQKGLAVVVMEPLLGGKLASPPPQIQSMINQSATKRSPAEWALQWLWDQEEVSVVLSGMSNLQQVQENVCSAGRSAIGTFSVTEQELIKQVREKYRAIIPIPCTKCSYCMPCPNGVNIPYLFEVFNKGVMVNDWWTPRFRYGQMIASERASECLACLDCESLCPQRIHISEWMQVVDDVLGKNAIWDGLTH